VVPYNNIHAILYWCPAVFSRCFYPNPGSCWTTRGGLIEGPLIETDYSFVITIDLVSIDSRGAAPAEALGLSKDTCGQTRGWASAKRRFWDLARHTTGMRAGFSVIHDEDKRFRWSLLLKPIPLMIRVVIQVVHLSRLTGYDTVGRDKIVWFDRSAVAECKRAVFKLWYEGSPCAAEKR
jgi:hypothetical protein